MADDIPSSVKFIDKERRRIELVINDVTLSFPLNAIPDPLYLAMATAYDGDEDPECKLLRAYYDTVMQPTVCTADPTSIFHLGTAVKTTHLSLTDEEIENQIEDIEGELLSFQGRPYEETLEERIELYRRVYLDDSKIDRFRFGAAELYGDVTYGNIRRDPRIVLNFQHHDPRKDTYLGWQVNSIAQIVFPGDPFYRFMRAMRSLFVRRFIDLRASEYPCAYMFHVCEVKDKSLSSRLGFVPI
ncbi:MAG: hypothetical protein ACXADS_06360 [Candidatus Thorarchaeota archaeon]